ncbi:MAG: gamma carbonic anhydrase family protein [Bacteroidota bacterium]
MAIIRSVRGFSPQVPASCFLAENSVVVGEVILGERCTIWYNAILRGDVNFIRVGDDTNIQDGAVVHCTWQKAGTTIGNRVSIGHNAIVHGCTIEDDVLIGMGAIVMDQAVVGSGSLVAAGAVVLQGTKIETGMLYAGVPAKPVRPVDDALRSLITRTATNYPMYAGWFKEGS